MRYYLLLIAGCLWSSLRPAIAWAQVGNGITRPASGEVIAGVVIVEGTAEDPTFLRYELAFFREANPAAGWIVFAEGDQPVRQGALAVWDTTVGRNVGAPVFPDGLYQLRLRVVRTDYNYSEYLVSGLQITNDQPTPTPTVAEGRPTAIPTSPVTTIESQPAVLPTLTPFPTPSPQATLVNQLLGPAATDGESNGDNDPGVLARLAAIDAHRFGRAFWQGVTWTGYAFAALFAYLLVRAIGRRLWRLLAGLLGR